MEAVVEFESLEEWRVQLVDEVRAECAAEGVELGGDTAAGLMRDADRFIESFAARAANVAAKSNERGLATAFAAGERVHRGIAAVMATTFNTVEERDAYFVDGHRSPQAFVQASVNISDSERNDRRHLAGIVKLCPPVGDLLAGGLLPVAHAVALGRLVANERIPREAIVAAVPALLRVAKVLPHHVFASRVREWGRLNDPDGSRPDTEACHRNRDVSLVNVLNAFFLNGRFGTAQGAKLKAIFDRFVEAEFDRDWQEAKQLYGDDTCKALLRRSDAQRRADALEAIFTAAIGEGHDIDIVVNIIADLHTIEETAAAAANAATQPTDNTDTTVDTADTAADTADTAADTADADDIAADADDIAADADDIAADTDDTAVDTADADDTVDDTDTADSAAGTLTTESPASPPAPAPADGSVPAPESSDGPKSSPESPKAPPDSAAGRRRFCTTLDGTEIDPLDALTAAVTGHVRGIVVGADGVIINQGRKQRLYTGNARIAALIQAGLDNLCRCSWPGCQARHLQIDHAAEWSATERGPTDVHNANVPCGHHNRWKHRNGYRVRRDEHGHWHTHRPDGTEIQPY